jgi:predicted hotdog family 3-hydroxylacyl-ACP dehydratase
MMQLDKNQTAALLPHTGDMCLLGGVLQWNEKEISCIADSHHSPDNPLRSRGFLHAISATEYAAQAMAVHSALVDQEKRHASLGYLASIRDFKSSVARLDTIASDLVVKAHQLLNMDQRVIYAFSILADGQTLITGRAAAVVLRIAP